MLHCGVHLQHALGTVFRMRAMNPDRHIYLATVVLAAVFATAINVLAPRDPFAGTIVHREGASAPQVSEASLRAPAMQQRVIELL